MKRSHEYTFLQLQDYCAKNNLPPPTVDKKDIGKRMRIQITVDGQTVSVKSKLGQNITEILNTASQNWFETHVHKVHEVSKDSTLSTVDSSRDSVQIEVEKSKYTKATVTPTVRQVFGMVFGNQMEEEADNDESEGSEDVVEVDSEAGSDSEDEVVIVKELPAPSKKVREVLKRTTTISDNSNQDVKFIGAGHKEGRRTYYRSAILNGDLTVTIGDTVLLQPHDPSIPASCHSLARVRGNRRGVRSPARGRQSRMTESTSGAGSTGRRAGPGSPTPLPGPSVRWRRWGTSPSAECADRWNWMPTPGIPRSRRCGVEISRASCGVAPLWRSVTASTWLRAP